ncbi:MAG TPA: hypothetical protein VED46_10975 [Alphaproteobacteria bacterium]|jgi:hypothetical protein|nr:hypothetical protein [Alphaproteobacteria bacterium]
MAQKNSRTERLFGRSPSDIPEWMAIRDADAKRRNDNQARLKAARLARDAAQGSAGSSVAAPGSGKGKRAKKKKAKP